MTAYESLLKEGREEGIRIGLEKKNEVVAKKMIFKGYDNGSICEFLDVSDDFVNKLRKENS